ncbi:MAG: hypothetical protein JXQ72_01175, partial [Anaerolineae bacterium]|nr:hypothetical protein [Anaerolineae bacterium]
MFRRFLFIFYLSTLVVLVLAGLGARLVLIADRAALEHDEAISILAAAGHQGDYARVLAGRDGPDSPYGRWVPARDWQRFMEPDEALIFGRIGADLGRYDIHPPLYFWLLHLWSLLVGAGFHAGPLLNVLFDAGTAWGVWKLASPLDRQARLDSGKSPSLQRGEGDLGGEANRIHELPLCRLAAVVLWALSPVALRTTIPARQYALFTLLAVWYALAIRAAFTSPSPAHRFDRKLDRVWDERPHPLPPSPLRCAGGEGESVRVIVTPLLHAMERGPGGEANRRIVPPWPALAVIVTGAAGLLTHYYFGLALLAGGLVAGQRGTGRSANIRRWALYTGIAGLALVLLHPHGLESVRRGMSGDLAGDDSGGRLTTAISVLALLSIPVVAALVLPGVGAGIAAIVGWGKPASPPDPLSIQNGEGESRPDSPLSSFAGEGGRGGEAGFSSAGEGGRGSEAGSSFAGEGDRRGEAGFSLAGEGGRGGEAGFSFAGDKGQGGEAGFILLLVGGQIALLLARISPAHALMDARYLGPAWPFVAVVLVRALDSR